MSAADKAWNLYVDKFGKEPISAQQLHNYAKEEASLDSFSYKSARETFDNNKGKSNMKMTRVAMKMKARKMKTMENKKKKIDSTENKVSIMDNPKLATYLKMKKIGMPMQSIVHKMTMDGISKDLIAQFEGKTDNDSSDNQIKKDWKNEMESKLDDFDDILDEIDNDIKKQKEHFFVERMESKQRFEERIKTARHKLEQDTTQAETLLNLLKQTSNCITNDMINNICQSFDNYAPFSEETLLMAWFSSSIQCEKILLELCEKILKYPIDKNEYEWFNKYIIPSSVWMFEDNKEKDKKYMFYYLLDIAQKYCKHIIKSMDKIYKSLENQNGWNELILIQNKKLIQRQDDKKVGLLKEKTILLCQQKINKNEAQQEQLAHFIDSQFAINILISTAKKLNNEFQNYMKNVMSKNGLFRDAPVKLFDRCQSKLENIDTEFPKAAILKDLIRCSVTFNTVFELVEGYNYLMDHIQNNGNFLEIAEIKNDFLNDKNSGYKDITINVIFHSEGCNDDEHKNDVSFMDNRILAPYLKLKKIGMPMQGIVNKMKMGGISQDLIQQFSNAPEAVFKTALKTTKKTVSMIAEIKFVLNNYLLEKKKLCKLYSILRQKNYFEMVVGIDSSMENNALKQIYNFESDYTQSNQYKSWSEQAYVNSKLKVLAIYFYGKHIIFFDLKKKKKLHTINVTYYNGNCCWVNYKKRTYFAAQIDCANKIELFHVMYKRSKNKKLAGSLFFKKEITITSVEKDQYAEHDAYRDVSAQEPEELKERDINFFEFDSKGNVVLVVNRNELQKRSLNDVSSVIFKIKLDENINVSCMKQACLSKNGRYFALGGGYGKNYFYIIDLKSKIKFKKKLTSNELTDTFAACMINEDFVAVGDTKGNIEIWNVKSARKRIKIIKEFEGGWITGMDSIGNMLGAVCYRNKQFKIWNTKNWEVLFTENIEMKPRRLNFSKNKKYLTLCGEDGERCSVWKLN